MFTYRPVDAFGAFGEPVAVTVEIAPQSTGTGHRSLDPTLFESA